MKWRTFPRYRRTRRRGRVFVATMSGLATLLFFTGLETWELWMLILIIYYVFWCTRKQ